MEKKLIIVRGGGDLATGTIHRLWSAGFPVLVLEAERPAAIRRQISVCEAIYDGEVSVEDMQAVRIQDAKEAESVIRENKVPVLADPDGDAISLLNPAVVIDAILAKKNLGTHRGMAPLTIALGPGFFAGQDVDVVIETMRGHHLGRIIREGCTMPNTGVPGSVRGYTKERVVYTEKAGIFHNIHDIGDIVKAGEVIAEVQKEDGTTAPVKAKIPGVVRGMLREGYPVTEGFKVADIDPREEEIMNCFTISDKARCIAGSVLEVVVRYIVFCYN